MNWYKRAQFFGEDVSEDIESMLQDVFTEMEGGEVEFYIRAYGSVCYDETGITFPSEFPIDWEEVTAGASDVRWEHQNGWSNQPKVVCFSATETLVRAIEKRLPRGGALGVIPKRWDTED